MNVKVEVVGTESYNPENVIITHAINDIPSATLIGVNVPLFEEVRVKIDGSVVFKGVSGGAQLDVSGIAVSKVTTLFGGLFKLNQMSVTAPGIQYFGQGDFNKALTNTPEFCAMMYEQEAKNVQDKDMINIFNGILHAVFTYVRSSLVGEMGSVGVDVQNSVTALYNFHLDKNQSVLGQELGKILIIGYLNPLVFKAYPREQVKTILFQMVRNPSNTFFNLLQVMCEIYQINLGTFGEHTYAFPNSPIGEPSTTFTDSSSIISINVGSFPLKVPTRCYITTQGVVDPNSTVNPSFGSYPPLGEASKPTLLESKIGAIRAIAYDCPPFATFNPPAKVGETETEKTTRTTAIRENLERFAKAYLVKECFKYRQAILTLAMGAKVAVGEILSFKVKELTFRGFVVSTSLNVRQATLSVQLQYVMEEGELVQLGLTSFGASSIYPNYRTGDLRVVKS